MEWIRRVAAALGVIAVFLAMTETSAASSSSGLAADGVIASSISAGAFHACGVKTDGTLACWGNNASGQANPPSGTFTSVSAGNIHSCGVKADGTLSCWGSNASGQANPPSGIFTSVSAASNHSCGVKADGTLACWGDNFHGQANPPSGTFTSVSVSGIFTCGVKTDGTLACWGNNASGQANPPSGTFTSVSAGGSHSCGARTDGTLACWGYNPFDGAGVTTPPSGTFTSVGAGGSHSCGVKTDGTLACWGLNTPDRQVNPPSGTFTSVSAGNNYSCGVKTDGTLACWGSNALGQLGGPPTITSGPPLGATIGTTYSHTFAAGPASGPTATFELASGTLPGGLDLDTGTGELAGSPTAAGTFTGTVAADNYLFGPPDTQDFEITIDPASTNLALEPSAGGKIGTKLTAEATLTGGFQPTGQIIFRLYTAGSGCSGTANFTQQVPVTGNGNYQTTGLTPTTPGGYLWSVTYSGDANNDESVGLCGDPVTILRQPNTKITVKPTDKDNKTSKIHFTSNDSKATFKCKLDAEPWKPCTSPTRLKNLKPGKHTFQVRATGAGGTDPTPAKTSFKVKKAKTNG